MSEDDPVLLASNPRRLVVEFRSWPRLCEKSHGRYDFFLNWQAGATDVSLCGRD